MLNGYFELAVFSSIVLGIFIYLMLRDSDYSPMWAPLSIFSFSAGIVCFFYGINTESNINADRYLKQEYLLMQNDNCGLKTYRVGDQVAVVTPGRKAIVPGTTDSLYSYVKGYYDSRGTKCQEVRKISKKP